QHRQRAEANKRAAEMDAFIAAIQSPVYFGTVDRFSNANRAGLELLGVASTDELRRLGVREIVERLQLRDSTSGELPSHEHSVFSRALAGEHLTIDCSALHRDTGSRCFYRCIAGPVISEGRLEGTVVVLSDITAIKRAEDRFRTMFERIPMAIAQSDPANGTVVRANAKMCELTGYPLEELVGRSFAEWTHPDDRADNMEQYRRMVCGEVDVYTTEKRYVRKDGSTRWVRVTAGLLPSPGEPARTLATIEDVTERRAAELEREQLLAREHAAREHAERARAELDRAAEFRERFLAIVSHDLRNPLNAILLTAQRLSSTRELPASFASPLGRIRASANRMAQMIAELLDLTRGRLAGGIPIELTKGDLLAIVRATIDELELAYPSRRILLHGSGAFEGYYDRERLAQVASNLIGNALQHGPADDPVDVSLEDLGDSGVILEVKNGGAPIPPELLPHLFEPFRRGTSSTNGLGLGLFIASEVVRAHHGTIAAMSTDAAGTTFTVWLPRCRGDLATSPVNAVPYAEPAEARGRVMSRR
ncbi:MAG TPA: PAS domain S-box protein, partial [Kofleriaceae bacterium]|nr:PAS domain S-box protein [Kofleriaceae bacterium]